VAVFEQTDGPVGRDQPDVTSDGSHEPIPVPISTCELRALTNLISADSECYFAMVDRGDDQFHNVPVICLDPAD